MSRSIQSIFLTGPAFGTGAPVYQIASTNCKGMLAPGARCQISVSVGDFAPVPRSVPGALTIVDSDPSSPQVVPLSVTELPEVTFGPAILAFAAQKVGTTISPRVSLSALLSPLFLDFILPLCGLGAEGPGSVEPLRRGT
jgi:hypothetical protein